MVGNADLIGVVTTDVTSEYADFNDLLMNGLAGLAENNNPEALEVEAAPALGFVAMLGDTRAPHLLAEARFEVLAESVPCIALDQIAVTAEQPAIMMYTSGTTADPKGCPLAHGALVQNGIAMCEQRDFLTDRDRFWAPLPMFHMASVLPMLCCFSVGAALLSMRHVEAGEVLKMMEVEKATVAFPSFPTVTTSSSIIRISRPRISPH